MGTLHSASLEKRFVAEKTSFCFYYLRWLVYETISSPLEELWNQYRPKISYKSNQKFVLAGVAINHVAGRGSIRPTAAKITMTNMWLLVVLSGGGAGHRLWKNALADEYN